MSELKETMEGVVDDLLLLPEVDSAAVVVVRSGDGRRGGTAFGGAVSMSLLGATQHLAHRISASLDAQSCPPCVDDCGSYGPASERGCDHCDMREPSKEEA
jgi:hypothetical protein